jgi:hypothetical protein
MLNSRSENKPSPWRRNEWGHLHYHIEVPPKYRAHSDRYIHGYMTAYLKHYDSKKRRPAETRKAGILG